MTQWYINLIQIQCQETFGSGSVAHKIAHTSSRLSLKVRHKLSMEVCHGARRWWGSRHLHDHPRKVLTCLQGYEARKAEAASKTAAAAAAPAAERLQEAADAAAEADTAEAVTEAANADAALAEGGAEAEDADEAGAGGGDTSAQRLQLLDAMTVSSAMPA